MFAKLDRTWVCSQNAENESLSGPVNVSGNPAKQADAIPEIFTETEQDKLLRGAGVVAQRSDRSRRRGRNADRMTFGHWFT